jgi:UDP-N-acetylmuramoylalanine--D-glutamate ligase
MKISIIGAARSGISAAKLANRLQHSVLISDSKPIESFDKEVLNQFDNLGINYEFGAHTEKIYNCDIMVVSPGVHPTSPIIQEAQNRGLKIISEMEFAYQNLKNPIIAITGTNGKTTTTSLIAHIFNNSGRTAVTAGNIGTPLSDYAGQISEDTVVVIEVSSFQLDRIDHFKPDVAIILNITPDHISYHGSMENYVETKWKITLNQIAKNLLILNSDDDTLSQSCHKYLKGSPRIEYFSQNPVDTGVFISQGKILFKTQHNIEELMTLEKLSLPGIHNAYNSMAAALAARAFEISNEDIRNSLMTFQAVEHRLEFVRNFGGVAFINDSKATNINAAWYALMSYKRPLVWIAGGRGDNNDYSILDKNVEENVAIIVAIGEEADAIFNHFCTKKTCIKVNTLQEAVHTAFENAKKDDIILFSPACKSFDMFKSYEERGEKFKDIVNSLK